MLKYPHLFEPIELAGAIFRNRIFAAPTGYMDGYQDGTLPPEAAAYYARKARGGAAAVTLGVCQVDTDYGVPTRQIKLDDPSHRNGLTRCAVDIARYGAVPSVELQHAGGCSPTAPWASPARPAGVSPTVPWTAWTAAA